jgi:molybdate transport system substrate-binding protein
VQHRAGALATRIAGGESFDVVVLTPSVLPKLATDGKVLADSVVPLAKVGIGRVRVPVHARRSGSH